MSGVVWKSGTPRVEASAQDPQDLGLIPMVIEQSGRGERAYDIYSRLLRNGSCSSSVRSTRSRRISSSRSCCSSSRRTPTRTSSSTSTPPAARCRRGSRSTTPCSSSSPTCRTLLRRAGGQHGRAASRRGRQGKRFCLPNSRVLIHQPNGRVPGAGLRHRDPRQGDPLSAQAVERDHGKTHRPRASTASRGTRTGIISFPRTRR